MNRAIVFLSLPACVLSLSSISGAEQDKLKKAAHEQAKQCQKALLDGDYVKVIDATLPAAVEQLGGRLKALTLLRQGMQQMKSKGYTITEVKVSAPSEVVSAGKDLVVIVPMVVRVKGPKSTMTQKSFLAGVSKDKGRKWSFLDGAQLTDANITDFIPNWPAKLKLPAKEKPTVEKN